MTARTHTIEVDEATAAALKARAAARGVTVSQLVVELLVIADELSIVDSEEIAELDRRWAAVQGQHATVPHENVVRWLKTWGTAAFKRWHVA